MLFRRSWIVLLVVLACHSAPREENGFYSGRPLGTNKNKKLDEASGLIASIRNPGCLWSLNDSGHDPELFLLDTLARTKKVFTLTNARNRDWEDITIGICPGTSTPCLYVGDIGDNNGHHRFKYIYRLPEPTLNDSSQILNVDTLVIRMDDGSRDTEALMFDPVSGNLYLVSKREKEVGLYEIANPVAGDTLIARKVATLDRKEIVAGTISPDGTEVLMKNYRKVFYWKKKAKESLVELLQRQPLELPYDREPMGESIAWARDGSGYYTLSENTAGERAKLYFYKRK